MAAIHGAMGGRQCGPCCSSGPRECCCHENGLSNGHSDKAGDACQTEFNIPAHITSPQDQLAWDDLKSIAATCASTPQAQSLVDPDETPRSAGSNALHKSADPLEQLRSALNAAGIDAGGHSNPTIWEESPTRMQGLSDTFPSDGNGDDLLPITPMCTSNMRASEGSKARRNLPSNVSNGLEMSNSMSIETAGACFIDDDRGTRPGTPRPEQSTSSKSFLRLQSKRSQFDLGVFSVDEDEPAEVEAKTLRALESVEAS